MKIVIKVDFQPAPLIAGSIDVLHDTAAWESTPESVPVSFGPHIFTAKYAAAIAPTIATVYW